MIILVKGVEKVYKFVREKILPLLLQREITVGTLSRLAGVSYKSARKALNGERTSTAVLSKIGKALGIPYDQQPKYICREGV